MIIFIHITRIACLLTMIGSSHLTSFQKVGTVKGISTIATTQIQTVLKRTQYRQKGTDKRSLQELASAKSN